jgi:hypothetical protein
MTFPWKSPENQPPGVGVITMNSPPVNSLGTELVTSFKQDIVGLFFSGIRHGRFLWKKK